MSGSVYETARQIVYRIPPGRAAAFGQTARLAGRPRRVQIAGHALVRCQAPSVPCHRVDVEEMAADHGQAASVG